jgi:hypothetical protein
MHHLVIPPAPTYRGGVRECEGSARGLYHRSGIHLRCKCHPAPKVFIWLLRLYPCGHKLHNSVDKGILDRAYYALTMQSTGQTPTHLGESA